MGKEVVQRKRRGTEPLSQTRVQRVKRDFRIEMFGAREKVIYIYIYIFLVSIFYGLNGYVEL